MAEEPQGQDGATAVFRGDEEGLDDLFDLVEPQPKYRAIIEKGGVLCPVEGFAVVASRDAVDEVLRNPQTYTSRGIVQLGNVRPLIPLSVDPPEHLKYRKILDPLFAPKKMDAIEDDIAARMNRFIDSFIDRGACHFSEELAVPFPSAVFLGLMGLPWEELDTLLRLKDGIMRPGGGKLSPDEQITFRDAIGTEIYAYFEDILDQRQKKPEQDILTEFLEAEVDGEKLSREEILDICFLFLIAGLDTVTATLDCMFGFLAQHPDHRRQLVDDPGLIPSAIEELLRWETPVSLVARASLEDTTLAGCPIAKGESVILLLGSANTDDGEVEDAQSVRFDREVNRHIAFGGGIHRCLGSHLARMELRVALREWHRRIPEYSVEPGHTLVYTANIRSIEHFPMRFTAAPVS
jgi:cytochrome P450